MSFFDCLNVCGPKDTPKESSTSRGILTKAPPPTSIFDDAMVMVSAALSVYIFADLRALARDDKSSLSMEDFEPPMDIEKMTLAIEANKEALKSSMTPVAYDEVESMSRALALMHGNKNGGIMSAIFGKIEGTQLVEFVDIEANKRLVHAITVNKLHKRITVAFRGSATKNDFITDSKIVQIKGIQTYIFCLL